MSGKTTRRPSFYSDPRHSQTANYPSRIPNTALGTSSYSRGVGGVASKDFALSWSRVMYPLSMIVTQCLTGMLPSRPWCSFGRVHFDIVARLRPKCLPVALALPSKNCSKYVAGVYFCRIVVDMGVPLV